MFCCGCFLPALTSERMGIPTATSLLRATGFAAFLRPHSGWDPTAVLSFITVSQVALGVSRACVVSGEVKGCSHPKDQDNSCDRRRQAAVCLLTSSWADRAPVLLNTRGAFTASGI